MPPLVLTLLQALILLFLYLFVARVARAVLRDLSPAPAQSPVRGAAPRPKGGASRKRSRVRPSELVVHTPDGRPRVIPLEAHDVTFGRAPTSTVVLDDSYISDSHARVYLADGEWSVSDLGSTNGTYLNQVKVTSPTPIAAGDQLAIGKTVVQVRK